MVEYQKCGIGDSRSVLSETCIGWGARVRDIGRIARTDGTARDQSLLTVWPVEEVEQTRVRKSNQVKLGFCHLLENQSWQAG